MQDYRIHDVRTAAILTNSYVAGTEIDAAEHENQLVLHVDFTIGSLTDGQIKVEYSHDGTNWYQESFSSISGGVDTISAGAYKLTADAAVEIAIPIKTSHIRISAIGTGTVTGSSMAIKAITGVS